jgi:ankyrin repeat protein
VYWYVVGVVACAGHLLLSLCTLVVLLKVPVLRACVLQVNSEDYDGWLPLHVACYYGAATVADMMLRRGAQVSQAAAAAAAAAAATQTTLGAAAAYSSRCASHYKCGRSHSLGTAASWNMRQHLPHGQKSCLMVKLLRRAAQVMSRTNKGQTPLHIAVEMAESQWLNREYNYGLTIKLLLGAGALINTADSMANTPLHVSPPVARLLVKLWSKFVQRS